MKGNYWGQEVSTPNYKHSHGNTWYIEHKIHVLNEEPKITYCIGRCDWGILFSTKNDKEIENTKASLKYRKDRNKMPISRK